GQAAYAYLSGPWPSDHPPRRANNTPDNDRAAERGDERQPAHNVSRLVVEPHNLSPEEVANTYKERGQQCPCVAKKNDLADPMACNRLEGGIGIRPRCRGEQPPGNKRGADIKRNADNTMEDRHRHRDRDAINLEMRRERPLYGLSLFSHPKNPVRAT